LPSEIELKLELSLEAVKQLLSSDILGEPNSVLMQTSTYFDTADRTLFEHGFTLRIRRTGEARMQTVKATGESASLFARSEWETPVQEDTPVLDHTSPLQSEFGTDLEVAPLFVVEIARRVWNIDESGSTIEVALDQGKVVSGERATSICEAEIELKDGDRDSLFIFARKLEAVAPFRFGARSKAERGFSLIEAQQNAYKAEPLHLDHNMRTISAFQTIVASCFRHFRLNEDILLLRRNAEALHQARVAIRRLRSAFSLFKPLLRGNEPQRLKDEFRWLAGVLGEARNLDVLMTKATDRDLRAKLKDAREAVYDDAVMALGSSRARALMLDFNEWLECGDYHARVVPGNAPAHDFAAKALGKMRRKLKKHGRDLAEVDDEERHQARKDAKKLRYAAEFFGSLFDNKRGVRRHKRFIASMEELQDHLGDLNDLATGPRVLSQQGLSNHPARDTVISRANKGALIDKAQASLDDVLDAKRFWR
jgi:inorganic triphosphatase YgiF